MVQVYHGTTRKFKEFDSIHLGGATKSRSARFGFWFTDDIETAKSYAREENNAKVNELIRAGKVEEASRLEDKIFNNTDTKYLKTISLSYNNPLTIDADGRQYNDYSEEIIDAIKQAVDNKNDVLIVKNLSDHADYSEYRPSTHYLVLDNSVIEQSKPDLKFELGGLYHGSPYDFNKFTTKEMGSGEGNQSFGWGLYFTDVKDIAKRYALIPNENSFYINGISLKDSSLTQEEKDIIIGIWREIWELGYAEDKDDFIKEIKYSIGNKAMLLDENDDSVFDKETIINLNKSAFFYIKINDLFSYADIDIKPNIYSVRIHKGKSPDKYDWLLFDKPLSESQVERILKKSKDEGFIKNEKDLNLFKRGCHRGRFIYDWLKERYSFTKSSDKLASLFLLSVGIDGIKYPSNNYGGIGDGFNYTVFDENAIDIETKDTFSKGGGVGGEEHKETYKKWKSLVNMSKGELEKFYNSQEGKDAGLSSQEASEQGISSGRESARWIMKMKDTNVSDWTPSMWRWAKKQISFISRMSGNKGSLYDDKGNKTRKHTSLLIWGHNPKKSRFDLGGLTDGNKGGEISVSDEFSTENYDFGNVGNSIKKNNLEVGQIQYDINKEKGIVRIYLLEVLEKGVGAKVINYFFNNGINIIYGDAVGSIEFWEKMGAKFDEFDEDINGYPFAISKEDFVQTKYYSNSNPERYADGNVEVKLVKGNDLSDKVLDLVLNTDELGAVGQPRLALLENGNVIGGIFLEPPNSYSLNGKYVVETYHEYKFDIFIESSKRKKGYSKMLLDAMIKDFVDNFPDADQIRGEVINKKLEKSLEKYYGFSCDSGNEENITYCYLSKDDAVKFKYADGGKVEPKSFPTFVDLDNSFPIDKGYRWADWQNIRTPTEINKVFKHYNIPLKAKKNLGKGLFGYAFLTDKDTVVKITNNSNEAFASFVIMQKGNLLTTQAKVFKMFKITNGSRSLYIIEKEYIPQVLENIKSPDLAYVSVLNFAKKVSNTRFADGNSYSDKELYEKAREYYQSNYGSQDDKMIEIIYKILKFYIDIEKDERAVNLDFDDIHTGNIGFKDDKLLCFDCAMTENTELKSGGMVD